MKQTAKQEHIRQLFEIITNLENIDDCRALFLEDVSDTRVKFRALVEAQEKKVNAVAQEAEI